MSSLLTREEYQALASTLTLPIFLVIQQWPRMLISLAVFVATSVILKFTWYDNLAKGDGYLPRDR